MKRTAEERKELVAKAWRLAVEGRTQHEIAAELGVCQGQVSRLLAKGRRVLAGRVADEMTHHFLLSLEQTNLLWRLAMEGFHRSCLPSKKTTRKGGVAIVEVEERDGDPEWIGQAQAALRLRHELIARVGLPSPAAEASGPSSSESRARLLKALEEAERRDAEYEARPGGGSGVPLE